MKVQVLLPKGLLIRMGGYRDIRSTMDVYAYVIYKSMKGQNMKILLLTLALLTFLSSAFCQEAKLDKDVYEVKACKNAILTIKCPDTDMTLVVILWDKNKNIETEIISQKINTIQEKEINIPIWNLSTGSYCLRVHLAREWSKGIDFIVIQ